MSENLVIVESPAKSKTIEKYLGQNYRVISTVGHLRNLPSKEGIDVNNNYQMNYELIDRDHNKPQQIINDIKNALKKANKVLFCDTNIWVTKVWSETHFDGYSSPQLNQWTQEVNYDYYLLTSPDIPWEKDDLRDSPNKREVMFDYFEKTLIENHFPFTCLKGSHEIRLKLATEAVQNLIKNNYAYRKRSN